ncbi:hypothetical protein CNR22_15280 [Sphingobacteriaceae bacterium]|nr:hypothetical protein CNR22_15280 [Sphingobacteriaceae bacterium]
MGKHFFIVLFISALSSVAQVLIPTPETAFELQHNFNPEVIKQKGIKKITFEIIDKKDFEVAVDKSLIETYEFNAEGRLSRFYFTIIVKTNEKQITRVNRKGQSVSHSINDYLYDTVSTTYFYSGNNLILKRYHDGINYYEGRYYRYDSLGNLTKESRFKETNNSTDRSLFILGNQVLLSEDSFQYKKFSSGQLKCTFLNNENRPYKERITNFDSLGRKKTENENYTAASWIMQESKYEYKGKHLVSAQFEGNAGNKVLVKNTYEYDDMDELYTEKQFKNDVLQKEISYVTNKGDSLLNSIVIRDPNNKSIRIVRLKYDFGMIGKTK